MKALFFPEASNPYQYLLAQGLARWGVKVEHWPDFPSVRWLSRNQRQVQVLHLHWLHILYHRGWKTPFLLVRFVAKLLASRTLGYKIVWTVHNIMPHESSFRLIDVAGRFAMMALVDAVIVHCDYAKNEIAERFCREKGVYVIPHGDYCSRYPCSISREQARRVLGIDDCDFVYLFFGKIRPYKGVEDLIEAFGRIDEDALLLIAGTCADAEQRGTLLSAASTDTRIRCFLRFVPEGEVQRFFMASDVLVTPFQDVLTSGSVILALSFGLPVVAPALGCLPELITPETGLLYNPQQDEALLSALQEIRTRDVDSMGHQATRLARALDWHRIGRKTREVYLACGVESSDKYDMHVQ